jgi:hypothetical protein
MAKSKQEKTPVDNIKDFCGVLKTLGVKSVLAAYDGQGDSGDFDSIDYRFDNKDTGDSAFHAGAGGSNYITSHTLRKTYIADVPVDRRIITEQQIDRFEDYLFSILPGGWEINDGSYGEITIDTETKKITVDHNERIQEVNSSSYEM